MVATEIIKKIKTAKSILEIFPDLENWKPIYKEYATAIHPDICSEPEGKDAMAKLNQFKEELESGKKYKDDAGVISYWGKSFEVIGDEKLLSISFNNYRQLMSFKDDSSIHFQKYIPETGAQLSANELKFTFFRRAVPLSQIPNLPPEHVNWILSRMLEFAAWINQLGYCHAGINPDSIWAIPEDHGMLCTSFYHIRKIETKLQTVSGKFSNLYPSTVFVNKKASSNIDLELAKRTAIYLLGDKSGTGTILRKTVNPALLSFLQKTHYNPIECFKEYREVLHNNFDTKKFHILNI